MFEFFKKAKPRIEDTEAYKMGQRAVESMSADLEAFVCAGFDPTIAGYLNVLEERFSSVYGNSKVPPLTLARNEFDTFKEKVAELRPRLKSDVDAAMQEWSQVAESLGVDLQQLIDARIDSALHQLIHGRLKAFIDRADGPKMADDDWRLENPTLAKEFPIDP